MTAHNFPCQNLQELAGTFFEEAGSLLSQHPQKKSELVGTVGTGQPENSWNLVELVVT